MLYRTAATVLADAEPDLAPVYIGAPQYCPFCRTNRVKTYITFGFSRRIVGRWIADRGVVAERCRDCDGRWYVRPMPAADGLAANIAWDQTGLTLAERLTVTQLAAERVARAQLGAELQAMEAIPVCPDCGSVMSWDREQDRCDDCGYGT